MINRLKNSNAGFTMIELLVVVAIIGILAAIAIPQYVQYREKAYTASMQADCVAIRIAEEGWYVDNDTYTDNLLDELNLTLSTGNSVIITAGDFAVDFIITMTSTKSTKTVTYNSSTGAMVTT